jgi:hypothetical protein
VIRGGQDEKNRLALQHLVSFGMNRAGIIHSRAIRLDSLEA